MKQGQFISEEKLLNQIIHILMEKLGPVETNRFLSLPARKRIESVSSIMRPRSPGRNIPG